MQELHIAARRARKGTSDADPDQVTLLLFECLKHVQRGHECSASECMTLFELVHEQKLVLSCVLVWEWIGGCVLQEASGSSSSQEHQRASSQLSSAVKCMGVSSDTFMALSEVCHLLSTRDNVDRACAAAVKDVAMDILSAKCIEHLLTPITKLARMLPTHDDAASSSSLPMRSSASSGEQQQPQASYPGMERETIRMAEDFIMKVGHWTS